MIWKLLAPEHCSNVKSAVTESLYAICPVEIKGMKYKPDRAVCLSKEEYTVVGSYVLPQGYIKGTTGAGDAFCAGTLIGIYKEWQDQEILEFASASAVMALGSADATSGLKKEEEIKKYCKQFDRIKPEV